MQAAESPPDSITEIVQRAVDLFLADLTQALPKILAGIVFLALGAVVVTVVTSVARRLLRRVFPDHSPVYRRFVLTVVALMLWFTVALSFLSVVGLGELSAALGTSAGFLALGVSYALSGMIADAVAGVYLLRDPDFNAGDTVTAGGVTGEVVDIELRKTRLLVDGDTVVRANAEIEKQWRKHGSEPAES
ncbi:mechanosensitive ion channel domain-containing protein [Haloarchaeobius sp. TZWWS8]|uniref:mechanosensitive ion channel domain-containing protein n=1 Tax=Haloarchaeobius sp. TZWWS8 TaxID=3446121 RepID=UPI003EBF503B